MRIVPKPPRGRPRYPDVLTPAEWRVMAGLRAGNTNAEIALLDRALDSPSTYSMSSPESA